MFVSYVLIGHYSNITIRNNTFRILNDFIHTIVKIDINKLSLNNAKILCSNLLIDLRSIESGISSLYTHSIPAIIIFVSLIILVSILNYYTIFFIIVVCLMIHFVVPLSLYITSFYDINKQDLSLGEFCRSTIQSARGIQYFHIEDMIIDKFLENSKEISKQNKKNFERKAWESIWSAAILFSLVCSIYFFREDYCIPIFEAVSQNYIIVVSCILVYTYFLSSYLKFSKIKKIDISGYIPKDCVLSNTFSHEHSLKKLSDHKDLFIAFHGVCFNDPSPLNYESIFDDLTFSILPGEMITITGEKSQIGKYIFDLILKFYTPQSGSIYIGGININNIDTSDIRRSIFLFEENFGIVEGNIMENISLGLSDKNEDEILKVAEKVDVSEFLYEDVLDKFGDIILSQDIMIRLQMARAFLSDSKVILIQEPSSFENYDNFSLFYEFVRFVSSRKTVILITKNPNFVIYSNKIIYIDENNDILFGSHADLAPNKSYQKFFSKK